MSSPKQSLEYRSPATTSRRRWTWSPWAITALVCGIVLVGFTLAAIPILWLVSSGLPDTETRDLSRAEVESISGVKLPPGAAELQSQLISWLDWRLRVRFTMPAEEFGAWIVANDLQVAAAAVPVVAGPPLDPYGPGGDAPRWWNPGIGAESLRSKDAPPVADDPQAVAQTQPSPKPSVFRHIKVDRSDPKRFVVWLHASNE